MLFLPFQWIQLYYSSVFHENNKLVFLICWDSSNNWFYQIVLNIRADRHLYGHLKLSPIYIHKSIISFFIFLPEDKGVFNRLFLNGFILQLQLLARYSPTKLHKSQYDKQQILSPQTPAFGSGVHLNQTAIKLSKREVLLSGECNSSQIV